MHGLGARVRSLEIRLVRKVRQWDAGSAGDRPGQLGAGQGPLDTRRRRAEGNWSHAGAVVAGGRLASGEQCRWREACLHEGNGLAGREDCLGTEPGLAIGPDGSAGVGLCRLGLFW